MTQETLYIVLALALMTVATFLTRAAPFLFLEKYENSPTLKFIGTYLPVSVMILLVIYCLKDTSVGSPPYGIPELLAVALIVVVHLWKRRALVSIGLGTGLYVFLVQNEIVERILPLLG